MLNLTSEGMVRPGVVREALAAIEQEVIDCRRCPRLVEWREQVAVEKRAAFRDERYWGRPVPGFGDPQARIVVLGLAPAAHGANRTGRVFTGDRSGDFLFAAMHRVGLANQPTSVHAGDGLRLHGAWVTASVKCAPPANAPTPSERDACAPFLRRELDALAPAVVVCLGAFGYDAACRHYGIQPRPRFGHGVEVPGEPTLLARSTRASRTRSPAGSTAAMLDAVFTRAIELAG